MENMSMFTSPSGFVYSSVDVETLGSTEYTLCSILVDESGSVMAFKKELEDCMKTIIDACKKHPKSGNLMARTASFSSRGISEIHGFQEIPAIDTSKYTIMPQGGTPLYDAMMDSVETVGSYAKSLNDKDFIINSIVLVLTDGENNDSTIATPGKIKAAIDSIRQSEVVESITTVLIGVNDANIQTYLDTLKNDAGFDQFISIGDVSAGKLAKLANWISQSISSTSQVLGSGGPSQIVSFTI